MEFVRINLFKEENLLNQDSYKLLMTPTQLPTAQILALLFLRTKVILTLFKTTKMQQPQAIKIIQIYQKEMAKCSLLF
jgi:hypothetical protein